MTWFDAWCAFSTAQAENSVWLWAGLEAHINPARVILLDVCVADSEEEDVIEEVKRAEGEDEERFLIITQDVKKTFFFLGGKHVRNTMVFIMQHSSLGIFLM